MATVCPRPGSGLFPFPSSLTIEQLVDVLDVLKRCGFPETRWQDLGLRLGLHKNTLDTIKDDNNTTSSCYNECLSKWLRRADNVDSKGGATWDSLSGTLRSMNEIAVADKLDQEKRPHAMTALSIFNTHHPLLSQSLCDPVNVTITLYREGVITQQVVTSVELASPFIPKQREVLLDAIREVIRFNYNTLQTFASVLCKFPDNAQLGVAIHGDYSRCFPRNDEYIMVKAEEVEIPVPKSKSSEFSSIRASFARMKYKVSKAIVNKSPPIEDLKKLIYQYNRDLKAKLDNCDCISSVVLLIFEEECSLMDIELLLMVVKESQVTEAEAYIEEYKITLKESCQSISLKLCLKEKFGAVENLKCETATYVFDWRPDENKLKDITDILSETSGRLVKIKYIDTGYSIVVTCSFPFSRYGDVLKEVTENLNVLKKNGLLKLTIGYHVIYDHDNMVQGKGKEEYEMVEGSKMRRDTPASGFLSVYTPPSSDSAISEIMSEISSPPVSPLPGAQPPSASNDPEKRKLIQQQLVLLLHAHHCQQREEREQQTHGGFRPCALPHCRTMKKVLNHMTECQAGRDCQFPHCASSRQIIYHWKNCNQQECPICLPLKTTTPTPNVGPSLGGANSIFGPEPPHLFPTGTDIPQAPPGGGALGPKPILLPNQTWHAEVNSDLRNHLIKELVEAIYPVPNPHNMHDSRVASLFQYAVKVEKMMFENASSREDYYQKFTEKIFQVRKELNKKRMNRNKGIIDKWLKEGKVELTVTRVNMHGPPGAGKTCAQHLLLNEDPPPADLITDSTPIARPTVRATRVFINNENTKWEKVTRAGLLERLASDLTVKSKHGLETASATDLDSCVQQPDHPHVNESVKIETVSISNDETSDYISNDDTSVLSDDTTVPNDGASVPNKGTAIPHDDETIVSHDKTDVPKDETETVIQEILDTTQKSAVQLSGHWLYIIDSGGQPAYQELLPLFIRTASLNIITLDLSQPLDKKLDFQYRIGGKKFSCGLNLKYSNRDFFLSAVSSGAILKPIDVPHVRETPSHPMHFVLGTHYDLIDEGTLEEINKELMSSLKPDMQNYVVHNRCGESIVFPFNTLFSVPEERNAAGQKLCQSVANCGGISLKIEMPIRWFTFELWLQKVAENKSHSFLQIDDVISAGERFQMTEDDTKYALQYLHNVTIILYYPDVLPGLVFINPQPILEVFSRLLALTYVERDALHLIINPVPLEEDINKLQNVGFFEEKLLYHLKSDVDLFVAPHFEPSHLIKLLLHLHVITRGKEGDYFFPCALQSYTNLTVPQTETAPLFIIWRRQDKYEANTLPVPQGLFPLLITHLLNQKESSYKVEFPPVRDDFYRYRDAMSLWVFVKGKRHTLHIINRYTHIEVYFNGSANQAEENCPHIRKLIMTAVKDSADAINVKHNHVNAFPCPINENNCYCVVDEDHMVVNCTSCMRTVDIDLSNKNYWCWFGILDSGPEVPPAIVAPAASLDGDVNLDCTHLREVWTLLRDGHFLGTNWIYLGDALGLSIGTLRFIENSHKDTSRCLRECIVKWLERADSVDENGGARWSTLIKALEECDQMQSADFIRYKKFKREANQEYNDEFSTSSKRICD